MANKRDLKKYIQNHLNHFAEQAYVQFVNGNDQQKEKADEALDKAANVLEEYSSKIAQYPRKNASATRKYFSDLKTDFEQSVDGLFEEIGIKRLA